MTSLTSDLTPWKKLRGWWRQSVLGIPVTEPWFPDHGLHGNLSVKEPIELTKKATPLNTVIRFNATFMEVVDAPYFKNGLGATMNLFIAAIPFAGVIFCIFFLILEDNLPLEAFLVMVPATIGFGILAHIGFYRASMDLFGTTHKSIRLNRATRKVHIFRHNSSGGVTTLNWDDITFCIRRGNGLFGTIFGYVSDSQGRVKDWFTLGQSVPVPKGPIAADDPLYHHWEYFRRYMEDSPEAIPAPEILLPIADRREPFLFGVQQCWSMFGPYFILAFIFSPLTTMASLFRWLGMHLSRLPRWPAEIESQCEVAPDDPYSEEAKSVRHSIQALVPYPLFVAFLTIIVLAIDFGLLGWFFHGIYIESMS